jgi:uncharacterized membrane protein
MSFVTGAAGVPRRERGLLLLASLALNLFFVAGLVTHELRARWSAEEATEASPRSDARVKIERLAATLPQPDGDRLRAAVTTHEADLAPLRAAVHTTHDRVRRALRAEPFDEAALRRAMSELRTARLALETGLHDVIAGVAAEMSPPGRAGLGDWPPPAPRALR